MCGIPAPVVQTFGLKTPRPGNSYYYNVMGPGDLGKAGNAVINCKKVVAKEKHISGAKASQYTTHIWAQGAEGRHWATQAEATPTKLFNSSTLQVQSR